MTNDVLQPPARWLRHHPSRWQRGTIDLPALTADAASLASRPGFEAAVREFARCWLEGYGSSPVLRSVMRNNVRYVMLLACLHLDHRRDPAAPEVSVTPGRVLDFYSRIDHRSVVGGLTRVKGILGHIRSAGLLRDAAGGVGDARRRPLEPTAALRAAMAAFVAGFLRGIEPVLPLPARPEAMASHPGFLGELFTYRLAGLVHEGFSINVGLPAMTWVTNREKGYPMLLGLLRSIAPRPDGTAIVEGVPGRLAEGAAISRGTARNFLLAAVEAGWFSPLGVQRWRLEQPFVEQLMQWMGREFLWMHTLSVAAWAMVARPENRGNGTHCRIEHGD